MASLYWQCQSDAEKSDYDRYNMKMKGLVRRSLILYIECESATTPSSSTGPTMVFTNKYNESYDKYNNINIKSLTCDIYDLKHECP